MAIKHAGQNRCGRVAPGQRTEAACPRPTGRLTPISNPRPAAGYSSAGRGGTSGAHQRRGANARSRASRARPLASGTRWPYKSTAFTARFELSWRMPRDRLARAPRRAGGLPVHATRRRPPSGTQAPRPALSGGQLLPSGRQSRCRGDSAAHRRPPERRREDRGRRLSPVNCSWAPRQAAAPSAADQKSTAAAACAAGVSMRIACTRLRCMASKNSHPADPHGPACR